MNKKEVGRACRGTPRRESPDGLFVVFAFSVDEIKTGFMNSEGKPKLNCGLYSIKWTSEISEIAVFHLIGRKAMVVRVRSNRVIKSSNVRNQTLL